MLPSVWGQLPPETQYEGIISTQGYSAGDSEGYEDDGYWGPEPIGFTFTFFGNDYNDFYFTSNGLLMFGTGSTQYSNYSIPTTDAPNNYIAPFWDDIMIDNTGVIYYRTIGTAPNRKLIVQWTNMTFFGANTLFGTFQVILYEGSNEIQMQYRNIVDMSNTRNSGSSATIGLENSDGTDGVQYSYNTADVIEPEMAIRWTPSGSSYNYDTNAIYEGVVLVKDITVPEPGIPALTSPANNSIVGTDVVFQWESADYADSYKHLLWEGNETNTIANADVYEAGTDLTYEINDLTLGEDYKWAVFSVNSSGETWSEIRSFTTSDAPPLVGVPKTYYLEEDGQTEVKLEYTGGDATSKTCRVTTMPPEGELYQYDNGAKGTQITSVPTEVTDTEYRLIYVATNGYGNDHGNFNFEFQDDTYTSDEETITINVSPPGVPVLQDVAFNTNIIELQFDRALNPVGGKESQFSAKLNGSENVITSVNLKEGDVYSIIVHVQDAQTAGDTKEISYTQGDVSSTGGGLLQSFTYQTADKQSQTITFTEIPDKTYGGSDFTLEASASSGLPVTFSSSNSSIISISGSTASINGAGTVNITAKQAGDDDYESAQYIQEVQVFSPEINITQSGTPIANGESYDFGSQPIGTDTDITFTVENTGEADLIFSETPVITIEGSDSDQFTVQQQPTSPVSVSGTTSFVIRFSPGSEGDKTATVSIQNNDIS
ncbi:MAG: choice-of-anchor D domain-containing protein, partial [bacterium]